MNNEIKKPSKHSFFNALMTFLKTAPIYDTVLRNWRKCGSNCDYTN